VPEKLHLLYPKSLAGRFELSDQLRANVEVADPRLTIAEPRQIDIEEVRELSKLILRLESVSSVSQPVAAPLPQSPGSPATVSLGTGMERTPSRRTMALTRSARLPPPTYLGPSIRDDMTDDELAHIIESLTTRAENVMSTLVSRSLAPGDAIADDQYVKSLGGFSSVLAALEQATKIDPRLIIHALSLMNGAMSPSG